jgi:hypothetical protein
MQSSNPTGTNSNHRKECEIGVLRQGNGKAIDSHWLILSIVGFNFISFVCSGLMLNGTLTVFAIALHTQPWLTLTVLMLGVLVRPELSRWVSRVVGVTFIGFGAAILSIRRQTA